MAKVDVQGQYKFRTWVENGDTYKKAWGWLGMPDQVVQHRSSSAQKSVSGGTGDDAGHLIGNRFGSPGGVENLSLQNSKANRYGTYKGLENDWASKRLAGIEIYVEIVDVMRPHEVRPYKRLVNWKERTGGIEELFDVIFMNTHTPESRLAQHIPPTDTGGKEADIIRVDFQRRMRLP